MRSAEFPGVFAAVDDKYSALIPQWRQQASTDRELFWIFVSQEVKEDGKMNVSDRQKAYIQINEDAESVFSVIGRNLQVLPFG